MIQGTKQEEKWAEVMSGDVHQSKLRAGTHQTLFENNKNQTPSAISVNLHCDLHIGNRWRNCQRTTNSQYRTFLSKFNRFIQFRGLEEYVALARQRSQQSADQSIPYTNNKQTSNLIFRLLFSYQLQ